jgi:hypothetical protein
MMDIDIILENRCVPPWRDSIICMIAALVLTRPKSVLANSRTVVWITAWSIDGLLQLDEGSENS